MSEGWIIGIGSIVIAAAFIFMLIMHGKESFKDGYKKGQGDALSGIQNYHLLEFKNGERDWYEKKVLDKNDFIDEYKDFKVIV